jgi:chromosome segregation protein
MSKFRAMEEQLDARNKEFNSRISALNSEIDTMRSSSESIMGDIGSNHDNLITLGTKLDNMIVKLNDAKEELEKAQGTPIQTEMSSTEMKNQITLLEREIEALGPINLRAIDEFDQENSNLEKMGTEIGRLNDERKDLENLMQKLNEQKKIVFNRLFKDINQKMNSIYYILSDGGEAGLEISDESDPLNSEIYIKARPKGTNFSKIEALSGGEKSLTALAFIMAVQRINPSPIYYLDEVDMFLDGSNAERIGRMFRENSYTSQILVVTLKNSVLKYADSIIGVTSFDDENSEVFEKGLRSDKDQDELKKNSGSSENGDGKLDKGDGGDENKD